MTHKYISYGITLMIFATMCVASGWVGVKVLGERLPANEIVFFRALVGLFILVPLTKIRVGTLMGNNMKLLVVRGLMGLVGMMLAFYAMIQMSLGDASMLLNTFPLFVALFAPFFLKEASSPYIFILAIVAFVGIGFILKPTWDIFHGASFAGLAAGIAVAFAMITIRKLHATDSTWTIALWFTAVIAVGSAPLLLVNFVVPTMRELLIILLTGFILTLSQLFLTKAYRYAKASMIAPFGYLSVIWSYGFDVIIWRHVPDVWSAIGSAIIIGAGIGILQVAKRPVIKPGATS